MSLFPDELDRRTIFSKISYFRSQEQEARKKLMSLEQNYDESSGEADLSKVEERQETRLFEPPESQRFCQYCRIAFTEMNDHVTMSEHQEMLRKEQWAFELIDKLGALPALDDSWDLDEPSSKIVLGLQVGLKPSIKDDAIRLSLLGKRRKVRAHDQKTERAAVTNARRSQRITEKQSRYY